MLASSSLSLALIFFFFFFDRLEFLHDYPELKTMHQIDGFDAISRGWKEKIGRVDWDSVWKYVKDNVDASVPEVDWITPGVHIFGMVLHTRTPPNQLGYIGKECQGDAESLSFQQAEKI